MIRPRGFEPQNNERNVRQKQFDEAFGPYFERLTPYLQDKIVFELDLSYNELLSLHAKLLHKTYRAALEREMKRRCYEYFGKDIINGIKKVNPQMQNYWRHMYVVCGQFYFYNMNGRFHVYLGKKGEEYLNMLGVGPTIANRQIQISYTNNRLIIIVYQIQALIRKLDRIAHLFFDENDDAFNRRETSIRYENPSISLILSILFYLVHNKDMAFMTYDDKFIRSSISCANCQSPNITAKCSGCLTAHYCNEKCQSENWHKAHKLICSRLRKRRRVADTGLELLRELTRYGAQDPIRHLARMLTVDDVQRMTELPDSGFMTDFEQMTRGMRYFWYERLRDRYPFFAEELGPFDPNVNYMTLDVARIYAQRLAQREDGFWFSHPVFGSRLYRIRSQEGMTEFFRPGYAQNNSTVYIQAVFNDMLLQIHAQYSDYGFSQQRAFMDTDMEVIEKALQYLFNLGFYPEP